MREFYGHRYLSAFDLDQAASKGFVAYLRGKTVDEVIRDTLNWEAAVGWCTHAEAAKEGSK